MLDCTDLNREQGSGHKADGPEELYEDTKQVGDSGSRGGASNEMSILTPSGK